MDFVDISSSFIIFNFLLQVKNWPKVFSTQKLAGFLLWFFFQDRGFGFIECKETQEIYGHLVDGEVSTQLFQAFFKNLGSQGRLGFGRKLSKKQTWYSTKENPSVFPSVLDPRKGHLFAQKRLEWTRNRYWRSSILADLFLSSAQYLCL